MKEQKLICDIEENQHNGVVNTIKVPMVFNHDQEDGQSKTKPYFELKEIELCEKCYAKIIRLGKIVYAYGAMGYNKYYLEYQIEL